MTTQPNPFLDFWQLGYQRLVPIIPHDAEISERSSLHGRVGTAQDSRGKAVGVRGWDGAWSGYDWIPQDSTRSDIVRWAEMGAGVGIKTGQGLLGIDADTLHLRHAGVIEEAVTRHFGTLPIRIGKSPKALYPIRVSEPFPYRRVEFGERDEKGRLLDRIEILSDGRQFVAHGIHPETRRPYEWVRPAVALQDLPEVSPAALIEFLEEMQKRLPAASEIVREGAVSEIAQSSLRGDPDAVERAVRATPNTSESFPTRESYRDYGYAIKAALPDEPDLALDLYQDWCARWVEGDNDPDVVAADWRRMKPPFRVGASLLYEMAERTSGGTYTAAEAHFDVLPDAPPPSPFEVAAQREAELEREAADEPIRWCDPVEWAGITPPDREWEVEGWVPRREVTLLYGDGGIGKTLAIHQYATAAAAGLDWLRQPTRKAHVMCFFCEDGEDELQRRQIDINRHYGIDHAATGGRLRIASRKYMDNLLAVWTRDGEMAKRTIWKMLLADAKAFGAEVIVVDTIADTFGGSEIDRMQVNAFVKSVLGALAKEIGGSVIALGHPSMAGKSSGSGTSGSTAWSNAARSRLFLRYPEDVESGNMRELHGMKLNYGPRGALLKLEWKRGAFAAIAGTTPMTGDGVADIASSCEEAVLTTIELAGSQAMSLAPKSRNYAPKVLKDGRWPPLEMFSVREIEDAVRSLAREGRIVEAAVGRKANRHEIIGLTIVQPATERLTPPATPAQQEI